MTPTPTAAESDSEPEHALCVFDSPVLTRFAGAVFRRAEGDGAPAIAIPLGERLAVVPLQALQREFGIADDSPDGRKLALVARALDFVSGLHLGDPLPTEVLTGEASWSPEPRHHAQAEARLRRHLLAAFNPDAGPATPERLQQDPALRAALQAGLEQIAAALGLSGWQATLGLLEQVASEGAYIEALRETLLHPVLALTRQLSSFGLDWRGDTERQATLTQVRRLAGIAGEQLARRFALVDRRGGDVLATLRDMDGHRRFVRAHRDRLYRSRRAFEPILAEWEAAGAVLDDEARARIARTYQFLAPRFMPVQEWEHATTPQPHRRPPAFGSMMRW